MIGFLQDSGGCLRERLIQNLADLRPASYQKKHGERVSTATEDAAEA